MPTPPRRAYLSCGMSFCRQLRGGVARIVCSLVLPPIPGGGGQISPGDAGERKEENELTIAIVT